MESIYNICEEKINTGSYEDRLKIAHDEYKNVFNLSRQLNDTKDVKGILHRLTIVLKEVVDFSTLALLMKEKYSTDFYLHHYNHLDSESNKYLLWLEQSGYLEWVCKSRRVSIVPNDNRNGHSCSMVLVPLVSGNQEIGVLVIFLELESTDITTRQSDLLSLLGTQAAMALENAFLYKDMALKNQAISNMKNFLENSLESMVDGLFTVDTENKISLFNSAAANLLGISPVEAIGCEIHRLFTEEFSRFIDNMMEMTYTIGKNEDEFNYRHPITGKSFPLGLSLSILKNSVSEQIGIIAVCRDNSERQELIHLRRLDQMKDEFISSVSHELRTPLTAIKSFTEILMNYETPDSQTQKEFLGIIDKETNRLIEIINDLLDLSQMNRDDFSLKVETIDIKETLNESLNLLKILSDAKNIDIQNKLDKNYNFVHGDLKRIVQVFVNLIGNAIKFSPESSRIEISSQCLKGKRLKDRCDYLKIAIKDNGCGIPEAYHKVVFEKFKQFTRETSTKPNGSGLGLAICKKIIEKTGGNIWVESEENKGSTFYFTLPLAKLKEAEV